MRARHHSLVALLACCCAASGADLDAAFVKMKPLPTQLVAGECFQAELVFRNTGEKSWGPDQPNHAVLRAQDPPDNATWGTYFIIQGQGSDVPPGKEWTYSSWLKAPATPGEYTFRWRLGRPNDGDFHHAVTLFGETSPPVVIRVVARPAAKPQATTAAPKRASQRAVLSIDDFEYAGSFRVPDYPGQDVPFSHSGLALRTMPDGSKRLFFNYTLPGMVLVELQIPELVKLDEKMAFGALKTAEIKQVWGKLEARVDKDRFHVKQADLGDSIWANGGYWWDEASQTLLWTWWHPYYCGDAPPVLGASKLGADGKATTVGVWQVGPGNFKWYWGGVTRLPADFAARYTHGRTLALGFGSSYSGTNSQSLGPSLAAVSDPDPKLDAVEATPLLGYYGGEVAPRDGNYFLAIGDSWMGKQPADADHGSFAAADSVRNGVFIETPHKHAFIAFAHLMTGRMGYDYGAGTADGQESSWYFYDPDDLGEVALGKRKLGDVVPRSWPSVCLPGMGGPSLITGSCFDAESRLLYLYDQITCGTVCIHAYRVKDDPPAASQR